MTEGTKRQPGPVLLAFPSTGHDISTRWLRSYVEVEIYDRERALQVWESIGEPESPTPLDLRLLYNYVAIEANGNLAKARNRLVVEFLDNYPHCDWLWFCDTDMVFPPDTLHRMIGRACEHNLSILGALCVIVTAEGAVPTLFIHDDEAITRVMLDYEDGVIAELAATGTGCLLIHRDVLQEMRDAAGGSIHAWFGYDQFTTSAGEWELGEDISFCLRAGKAPSKWKTYVDTTMHVGHHKGPKVWWPEDVRTNPVPKDYFMGDGSARRDTAE
jgi:hypothetical protein